MGLMSLMSSVVGLTDTVVTDNPKGWVYKVSPAAA